MQTTEVNLLLFIVGLAGTENIQAKKDITVLGNVDLPSKYENFGAVATKGGSNSATGGTIDVRSLEGKIIASDRAFDNANRYDTNATINLLSKDNIDLSATGRSNSVPKGGDPLAMPVVSTQAGKNGKGGTNTLRSYSNGITIGPNAQVLANWSPNPGSNGTNLLTSCTGVTNNGTVNPADLVPGDDSGVCAPGPPSKFTDCPTDFGITTGCTCTSVP
jgi:hypothetical protein